MDKELDKSLEEQYTKRHNGYLEKHLDEQDLRRYNGFSLIDKVVLLHNGVDNTVMKLLCLRDLENYLRAPSQKQVCEALSEYYKKTLIYQEDYKVFCIKCSNGYYTIIKLHSDNELVISPTYSLPPHLTELVGKFYKGVLENE